MIELNSGHQCQPSFVWPRATFSPADIARVLADYCAMPADGIALVTSDEYARWLYAEIRRVMARYGTLETIMQAEKECAAAWSAVAPKIAALAPLETPA